MGISVKDIYNNVYGETAEKVASAEPGTASSMYQELVEQSSAPVEEVDTVATEKTAAADVVDHIISVLATDEEVCEGVMAKIAEAMESVEGEEKVAEEQNAEELMKIATELDAAGRFMAHGFINALNEAQGGEDS